MATLLASLFSLMPSIALAAENPFSGQTLEERSSRFIGLIIIIYVIYHTRRERKKVEHIVPAPPVHGVSGWLLFMILSLGSTEVISLVTLTIDTISTFMTSSEHSISDIIINSLLSVWSLVVLFSLYHLFKVNKGAVKLNKIVQLISAIIALCAPLFGMVSYAVASGNFDVITVHTIKVMYNETYVRTIVVIETLRHFIWFLYLCRSQRVANTWAYIEGRTDWKMGKI